MTKPIAIIGAGRAGRFTADIAEAAGLAVAGFIVDSDQQSIAGYPVLFSYQQLKAGHAPATMEYVIALGDPNEKWSLLQRLTELNATLATVIHPMTFISRHATIHPGCIINAFTSIMTGAVLQTGVMVEDHCGVGVDVEIGACTTLAPGCHFNAQSRTGIACFIGSGATVHPEAAIGDHCTIGSNAAITRDVLSHSTVAGVPGKVLRTSSV